MKIFTKLNILVIFLTFAAFSSQQNEGLLAEPASSDTRYHEMAFTVQVTDLDGFQIFKVESFSSYLKKMD